MRRWGSVVAVTLVGAGALGFGASLAAATPRDFGPTTGSAVATQSPPGSCPSRPASIPFTATVQLSDRTLTISDPGGTATGDLAPDGTGHLTSPQGETYDVVSTDGNQLVLDEVNGGCNFRTVITFDQPLPPLAETPATSPSTLSSSSSSEETTSTSSSQSPVTPGAHLVTGTSYRWVWVLVVVVGGLLVVLAWILHRGPVLIAATSDCDDELRRWQELQRACDEARAAASAADADAKAAIDRRDVSARDAAAYRSAHPGVDPSGDNSYVEDVATGDRVTITDVELQRQAEQAILDEYRRTKGPEAAAHAVDEFRKADTPEARAERRKKNVTDRAEYARLQQELRDAEAAVKAALEAGRVAHAKADAACRQADVARRAYEECIRQAAEAAVSDAAAADDGLPTDELPKPKTPVTTTDGGGGKPDGDTVDPNCDCGFFVELVGPAAIDVSECFGYRWSTDVPATSELQDGVTAPAEQRMLIGRPVRPERQTAVHVRDTTAGQVAQLVATRIASECWGGATISGWQHRWTVTPATSDEKTDVVHVHVEVTATVQCPGHQARIVSVEASTDVRLQRTKCCCGPDVTDDFLRCVNRVIERLSEIHESRDDLFGEIFMAANGVKMVYRPMSNLGVVGAEGCPCESCVDTITLLDVCVNAHFTGDFLFGLCGGWFGIEKGFLWAGGKTAKWGHYPGFSVPDTSAAERLWESAYALGERAFDALDGNTGNAAAVQRAKITREDLAAALSRFSAYYRRDCEPCPHLGPVPPPLDFSTAEWGP